MRKKVKVIVTILCLAVAVGLFYGGNLLIDRNRYKRIISEIELQTPNLLRIQDGTFNGVFDAIFVSADVNVTIENHRIVEIIINEHYHGRASAVDAEVVIEDVILMQSLEVDTISGATNSSKVILSAIRNALESAMVEQS